MAAKQREVIQTIASSSNNVHVLDLKAMVEAAGYEQLYGRVDKHFSVLGYYLSAKAINEWINGSWRSTSAATPPMKPNSDDPMQPDCNAAPRYAEAFSAPSS